MTTNFLNLQIPISTIRPHIKWAVSLVIAFGHFELDQLELEFLYVLVNILILSSQRVTHKVGCLVTVYFHFDHPNKRFVLVYMYGLIETHSNENPTVCPVSPGFELMTSCI